MIKTIQILEKLVAFETVSAQSNLALIDFVEDFLRSRGFTITRIGDKTGTKAGIVAKIGPAEGGLLLSAHSDVVPVSGQSWTRDPFKMASEGGKVFGRGTTDMKGFLASMLAIADLVTDQRLREPLIFSISYDEEVGCRGIAQMVKDNRKAFGQPSAAIIGEPTEMGVAVGHKGKVAFRGQATGEDGHSSLAPKFRNALYVANDFVNELRKLQDWLRAKGARDNDYDVPYSTVHLGRLAGGTILNMVPSKAELEFEIRFLAEDAIDEILERIDAMAGPDLLLERTASYPGLATAQNERVVARVLEYSGAKELRKVSFGTEAGFFQEMGIPAVVCGPGSMDAQGHKPDEYIERSQLMACDVMLSRAIADLVVP